MSTGIYRKVHVSMWRRGSFTQLSAPEPNGQFLWLWLLTGPLTMPIPGIIPAGKAAIAEELGWKQKDFLTAFQEIVDEGMIYYSWDDRLLWLPQGLEHNPPESTNVIRSWASHWQLVPECTLKHLIYKNYREYFEQAYETDAWVARFVQTCGRNFEHLYQEGYPDQSFDGLNVCETPKKDEEGTQSKDTMPQVPYDDLMDMWNERFDKTKVPNIEVIRHTRQKHVSARWKEYPDLDWWEGYFEKILASDFLCGRLADRDFVCSFDWVIKPSNLLKVLEGNYDNKPNRKTKGYNPLAEETSDFDHLR